MCAILKIPSLVVADLSVLFRFVLLVLCLSVCEFEDSKFRGCCMYVLFCFFLKCVCAMLKIPSLFVVGLFVLFRFDMFVFCVCACDIGNARCLWCCSCAMLMSFVETCLRVCDEFPSLSTVVFGLCAILKCLRLFRLCLFCFLFCVCLFVCVRFWKTRLVCCLFVVCVVLFNVYVWCLLVCVRC